MNPLRALLRDPRTSVPVVLLLAVGAGGFAWLVGLQRSLMLRSLPVPEPARLVSIRNAQLGDLEAQGTPSYGELERMRQGGAGAFSGIAAHVPGHANIGGDAEGGRPEVATTDRITANALQVLGVSPALGRDFNPQDEVPGQEGSAILTDAFWRSRFGADPEAIGRTIRVDGRAVKVVGVLPPSFHTPWGAQVFLPLAVTPEQRAGFGAHYLHPFGRLRPGVSVAQGAVAMAAAAERLKQDRPDLFDTPEARKYTLVARPLLEDVLGGGVKAISALRLAAVLVLILAALNASALLVARAQGRRRELAVRAALGAAPGRLRLDLLAEGAALGLLGAALGALLAALGLGAAGRALQWSFPGLDLSGLRLDGPSLAAVLAFGPALGALCALAARIEPNPAAALKESGRGQVGGPRRLRQRLVLAQLALATALLGGAAWLQAGVGRLLQAPLGLRPDHVWTFGLSLPRDLQRDPARLEALASALAARLSAQPGIQAAGAMNGVPMGGLRSDTGLVVGDRRFDPEARGVTPGGLETLGIRLLKGRGFTQDDRAGGQPVAILTRGLAQAAFGGEDPIGRTVTTSIDGERTVVGVVDDVREFGPADPAPPMLFIPYSQGAGLWNTTLHAVFRASGPAPSSREIQRLVNEAAPDLGILRYAPLEEGLQDALGPQRMARAFLMAFAALAIFLAAGGVYGLMAASVAERRGEFGIRSALGATALDLLALVLRETAVLAALGAALGLPLAFGFHRLGDAWLQAVPGAGTVAALQAALLLFTTALAATLLPALRAARVDPMTALRAE